MNATQLLLCILAALLLQLLAGLGVFVWRRRTLDRLPLAAPERPLVASSPPGAWAGWRDFRVARRQFEDRAKSQCSFYLQPVDGLALPTFLPGQYLTLSVPMAASDAAAGAGVQRQLTCCYSLSDRPDLASYRLTIKRMPPPPGRTDLPAGAVSCHLHDQVKVGDVLRARAPAGRFVVDADPTVPAVFIAGGIGITPLLSMLRWCAETQPDRQLHLYQGVHNSEDHAFKAEVNALAQAHATVHSHVAYSSPTPDDVQGRDYEHQGHINLEYLRASLPAGRHQFYVCGPPLMMTSLVAGLRAWGVNPDDIHFEAFGPASGRPAASVTNEPLVASQVSWDVRLQRSDRTLVWNGQDPATHCPTSV